jgi:hypothetical protein
VFTLTPEEKMLLAARLRAIADGLLIPTATLTGLPPSLVQGFVEGTTTGAVEAAKAPKKRKVSAYNRKYKAAFKRLAPKYKLKNGNWKKNGFRAAVKAAHKAAGGKKK